MNKKVFVIGGGTSLRDFDFNKVKDETTIAVNKSYYHVPNLNYFVTIDFTVLRKIGNNINSPATKIFIANFSVPSLQEIDGRIIDTRWNLVYDLKAFDIIIKSRKKDGIGFTFKDFRTGGNSGYCALQLAIALGYTEINLLGMDLVVNNGTHFHGGYGELPQTFSKKLDPYYDSFRKGLEELKIKRPDIKVYSCSKISRLNSILEYKEI